MNRYLLIFPFLFYFLNSIEVSADNNHNIDKDEIVIATWNIGHFSEGKVDHSLITSSDYNYKINEFRTFVYDTIAADILCVNEYSREFCRDSLRGIILAEDSLFYRFKEKKVFKQNRFVCNAIFSNRSIENAIMHPFLYNNDNTAKAEKHSIVWHYYVMTDISINGQNVKLVCTHLVDRSEKHCQKQIKELIKECDQYDRVIICGDMNTWNYFQFEEAGYLLANDGNSVTFPSKLYSLDNIIVKGLNISNVRIVKTDLSDHYSVSCKVSL